MKTENLLYLKQKIAANFCKMHFVFQHIKLEGKLIFGRVLRGNIQQNHE